MKVPEDDAPRSQPNAGPLDQAEDFLAGLQAQKRKGKARDPVASRADAVRGLSR